MIVFVIGQKFMADH